MLQKIAVAAVSAMLSGGLTMGVQAANTAGRLTMLEAAVERVSVRLDTLIDGRGHQDVARAAPHPEGVQQ